MSGWGSRGPPGVRKAQQLSHLGMVEGRPSRTYGSAKGSKQNVFFMPLFDVTDGRARVPKCTRYCTAVQQPARDKITLLYQHLRGTRCLFPHLYTHKARGLSKVKTHFVYNRSASTLPRHTRGIPKGPALHEMRSGRSDQPQGQDSPSTLEPFYFAIDMVGSLGSTRRKTFPRLFGKQIKTKTIKHVWNHSDGG